ncbi:hypothetical protein IAR55_004691 [Kwoniella newhampshirensis]|uniref:Major facilitator superfamily (MFS) profile domain-containing protein n=1 Tax=Kwoniella newhampshirensis TaxID=1651941 RepID=A0AAW0YYA7_9TREE
MDPQRAEEIHPDTKDQTEHVELTKGDLAPALKSNFDELGLLATAWKFRKAVMVSTLMCVAAACDGYQINLNGNIIANSGFTRQVGFKNSKGVYVLNANNTALWGALQSLGQLVGMLALNPISDKIGRKYTLYALWLILAVSLIIETTVRTANEWAAAKFLAGMGVGAIQSTMPIYITEWAPPNIRGAMITAYAFWNNLGGFLAPLLLYLTGKGNQLNFRVPIYTQWAFLGVMLPIFIYLPETAQYFAARDQDEKGIATLRRVNGYIDGYSPEAEYAIVKNIIIEERALRAELGLDQRMGWKETMRSYAACFDKDNWRRTLGSTLPACMQQLVGLAFLNNYASLFFKQSGFANAFLITTIITGIKMVAIIILSVTTDKTGRRPTVLGAAVICTLSMLIVGIMGQVHSTSGVKAGLIFVACVWSMANSVLGSLGWTFVGEVAAQRLRARTAGIAAGGSVLFGLTFNTALPKILDVNGANWGYNTAWLFLGTGIVACIMGYLFVPETARRNAAELDELFDRGVPAWRMRSFDTDVQKTQQGQIKAREMEN